jgi:hypothetical protein
MALGSVRDRRRILTWLKNTDRKYYRPFETGEMNVVNILGGSWNEYAEVVFSMLVADTLLNVEEQLRLLNAHLAPERFAEFEEIEALEAAGGLRWLLAGTRYLFGETAEPFAFGIWDRDNPGPPIERFPHTAEGRQRVEETYRTMEPNAQPADDSLQPWSGP